MNTSHKHQSRTCPHCGNVEPLVSYITQAFMPSIDKDWECSNCQHKLRINIERRFIVALLSGFWMVANILLFINYKHLFNFNLAHIQVPMYFLVQAMIFRIERIEIPT